VLQEDVGDGNFVVNAGDEHSLLRPETVESLFVLYRVTGNSTYQEWAWQIFRALEMHARLPSGGYASLDSVLRIPAPRRDSMESFFIAETLKYLLLLFSPQEVRN
jgi:endoplasmic reticulum Man9GlcNAc2 1,2-alpha-mannosidase